MVASAWLLVASQRGGKLLRTGNESPATSDGESITWWLRRWSAACVSPTPSWPERPTT